MLSEVNTAVSVSSILCSRKFSWGPNFVLFVLSLFNTWNIRYDGRVFLHKIGKNEN